MVELRLGHKSYITDDMCVHGSFYAIRGVDFRMFFYYGGPPKPNPTPQPSQFFFGSAWDARLKSRVQRHSALDCGSPCQIIRKPNFLGHQVEIVVQLVRVLGLRV